MKYWSILFLLFYSSVVSAQTEIKGNIVSDEDGKTIPGISVTIREKNNSNLLNYALTDDKGNYKIAFKSASDTVVITVSGFNIKKESRMLPNRNQNADFKLSSQAIELKEVKITPSKIRQIGDTLNYLVDGYMDQNDRTIGDVLKKMPGIEVKESGEITYNNKPINKFYIEDADLLQGRYGVATNNISARDVSTVQVLENHQPIKALKDKSFSEEAALNLKLKDSAKGVLVANAQAGAGFSPFLWNNELFSMYFTKGRQNMNTYKGNNTGDDVSRELTSFYSGDASRMSDGGMLAVQSPASPAISRKRYLFNRANAITVNNLWSLNKDYRLNANFSYLNDRQEKDSYSRSDYYLPGDSLLTVEEKLGSKACVNQAEGEVQLNCNREKSYLNNLLKFSGNWNSEDGKALSTTDSIFQKLDRPSCRLNNTFQWIRDYSKSTLEIYSFNGYMNAPQTLSVQPVLYADLFDKSQAWNLMRQDVTQRNFSSNNRVVWQLPTGKWRQNYLLGFKADLQRLDSDLQPEASNGTIAASADSLRNDLRWNRIEWTFMPSYIYQHKRFRATLNLPLDYNFLHINDQVPNKVKDYNKLFFNPYIGLRYELDAYWNISASASYLNNLGGINNGYTGYIMHSYRSLLRNDGNLLEKKNQNYNLSVDYRHPIYAFFGNLTATYFNTKANLLYGNDYHGILSVQQSWMIPNTTEGGRLQSYLSKGIDAIASTVSMTIFYNNSRSSQISQNEIVRFKNNNYTITPGISTKFKTKAGLSYFFTYSESRNKVQSDISSFEPIRTSSHDARLSIFPFKELIINLGYEFFYNNAIASGNRTVSFGDLGIKYKLKNVELNLSYTNILNTKQYVSASYNDISTYYYAYDLRPAEVLLKVRFKLK